MQAKETKEELHKSVLKNEVLLYLKASDFAHLNPKAKFIDATLGLGGHTLEFIKLGIEVLGIEQDEKTAEVAGQRIKEACPANYRDVISQYFTLAPGNFRDIDTLAIKNGFENADGILIDLGISSYQLDDIKRGFSFEDIEAPLDMRLSSGKQGVTASDLLKVLNRGELIELFSVVLENKKTASKIADTVIELRKTRKVETVGDFLDILEISGYKSRKNSPSLPFLALRIAVNTELESLRQVLPKAFSLLKKGGRLAVISFHSGEDAIVKSFFREKQEAGEGELVTKKPVVPSDSEILENSRARSGKLRVIEKL